MRILFLTQIVPFPPDAGPRIKTWQVLRYLAGHGHRIVLVSFMRAEEQADVAGLHGVCEAVHTVSMRRSRYRDVLYWLGSLLTGRPFLVERDFSKEMDGLVQRILATESIDVVHIDQLTMAQYVLPKDSLARDNGALPPSGRKVRPFFIYDAHNAMWTLLERMGEISPWFLAAPLAIEARRMRKYEGQVVQQFDHTLAVSEVDRLALLQAATLQADRTAKQNGRGGSRSQKIISVIPIAVNTDELRPIVRQRGSRNILALGSFHYPPNADGVIWFVREVFPIVDDAEPGVTLTIVGRKPPRNLLDLAYRHPRSITVTGYVRELQPHLEKAAVMVVPVRAGGGMRVRILEGFARGIPIVTTSMGIEGIDARPGQDLLVADRPIEFADHVLSVLRNEQLQNLLAVNGRERAEAHYSPRRAFVRLEDVYNEAGLDETRQPF